MIDRKMFGYIREFFTKENKALLISGARQVGKTYAVRHVGREMFERVVELNFIEDPSLKALFANPRNAKEMLLRLSAYAGGNLQKGKTLFFFDEIQECPDIMTAIKFLVDEGSYRYVMSGSLLGVQMKDIRSLPVGYLTEKKMYPLDLEEFAKAVGMSDMVMSHLRDCYERKEAVDAVIHAKMLELVNLLRLNEQRNLFKLFLNDVGLLSSYYPFELSLKIIMGEANINYGAIYENLAAQELVAHGYSLYYFNSKRQGEIDFVIEHEGYVVPMEIKSGKDFKRHNALSNVMATPDYGINTAFVMSNSNLSSSNSINYLPIYMLMFFRPVESSDSIIRFAPI